MIVVTGAAGFIGSHLIDKLNQEGFKAIIAVDLFHDEVKLANLDHQNILASLDRRVFIPWLEENAEGVEFIFHLGAHTDTTETDEALFAELNTNYTKQVWNICATEQIPLIYASSAATYGLGELGFSDDHSLIPQLQPLNAYAHSKHQFDLWALGQEKRPFYWAGLKFFNVYGKNEDHKGKMSSMVYQLHRQIEDGGKVRLFKSYDEKYDDGEQLRDFVYVQDVVNVMYWMMHHRKDSGIYNVGTGQARSFKDVVNALQQVLDKQVDIEYIDMPEHLRDKYQYFTEADLKKLKSIGFPMDFSSLEDGVRACCSNLPN
ncbi:ADP-glyceromanno-heptose 6-epimerase precursor [Marinoscillum furvescens DSM 4134]|uniref:ADP-glyceromanno-heptose 6-epimerase n=2 Tax=Marinoscillum furvescens TaxID=1026 RepID=A0A3D9KXN1_MARFU|nr:ADP-glyceromanno-heptose 6-epimerase precursor [Marinoscillum furvescens DSM 4134]